MLVHPRYLDEHILEHALTPHFWILGSFIGIFCIATLAAAPRSFESPIKSPKELQNAGDPTKIPSPNTVSTSSSSTKLQPRLTSWLKPHLTNRFRIVLALFVYLVILGAQLLEGYWVGVTMVRWTMRLFSQLPNRFGWVYAVHTLSIFVFLLLDFVFAALGFFFVLLQITCIAELIFLLKGYRSKLE